MKILLDARMLNSGGIGRFIREVSKRWLKDSRVSEIHFLGSRSEISGWLPKVDPRGIGTVVRWPGSAYSMLRQVAWPWVFPRLSKRIDVSVFPHYDVPMVGHPARSVVMVHDLIHFRFPSGFPMGVRLPGRVLMNSALHNSSKLVTVSQHSRNDIIRWNPSLADKLSVITPGVSEVFRPLEEKEREDVRHRWGGLQPFLLTVGPAKAHKNLELAVEVLAEVRRTHPNLRLLMVGAVGRGLRSLHRRAAALGVEDAVVGLGFLRDEYLRELYGAADALLFPSKYEGFGIPPLEAMACGCPVVASNLTAVPESVGKAGWLVDPENKEEWVRVVSEVVARARVKNPTAGRLWASGFSWDQTADKLLRIVETAA
jgi:glycosyltransferase involved in cell wall biosynthesis